MDFLYFLLTLFIGYKSFYGNSNTTGSTMYNVTDRLAYTNGTICLDGYFYGLSNQTSGGSSLVFSAMGRYGNNANVYGNNASGIVFKPCNHTKPLLPGNHTYLRLTYGLPQRWSYNLSSTDGSCYRFNITSSIVPAKNLTDPWNCSTTFLGFYVQN